MKLGTKFRHLIVFTLSVSLSITASLPKGFSQVPRRLQNWQISQKFTPPNRQAPRTTAGGGTRGGACLASKKNLQPLIPQNKLGLTLAERPSFYWFVSPNSIQTGEFSLLDGDDIVYSTTVKLPDKPGIMGFTLPSNAPSLKVGEQYHWYFAIACSLEDTGKQTTIDGWVERIQTTPALSKQLASTNPKQLSQVYASAGIWHEALQILVQQRLTNPSDRTVIVNWRAFLDSVGLNNLVSQPLINNSTENTQAPQANSQRKL
ncbi:DUF928 domain-containing protein [Nostoc sp. FACHB-110]|uniref:DUF928 domain-containing protein n=1 Tax=Nostoc sp. FACHB-110 TaxID=2692834 RepID=UPI001686F05C|nr:DUF928 domain-containing protein [Nostoc sp. FACHB-110]MBD2438953.1 DUF928 domain-containing protein [Nostoc sp. FACHB-110]